MQESTFPLAGVWTLLFSADTSDDSSSGRSARERGKGRRAREQAGHSDARLEPAAFEATIAGIRAGDEQVFTAVVDELAPGLLRFSAQLVRSHDAAQDIVQDVLYRVWEQRARLDPKASLAAYLFTAVRNRSLHWLAHQQVVQRSHATIAREQVAGGAWVTDADRAFAPNDNMAEAWVRHVEALRIALAALTEHQRSAIDLRYNQGLTIAEVARVLGISPKGVERLMTRVRKLLRDQVLGPSA